VTLEKLMKVCQGRAVVDVVSAIWPKRMAITASEEIEPYIIEK